MREGLFRLKSGEENSSVEQDKVSLDSSESPRKRDYQKLGMLEAGKSQGVIISFKLWLRRVYVMVIRESREFDNREKTRLTRLRQEIIGLKGKVEKLEHQKGDSLQQITTHKEHIEQLQKEIHQIKGGEKVDASQLKERVDPIAFIMGSLILFALTAYLIIFYTSVIYSAFIYDVKSALMEGLKAGDIFLPTIVNLKAIPKTHAEYGWIGSTFLIVSTSMFIALGYLIHKFEETKQYGKVVGLFVFTLLFDAFLAYQIVEEINIAKYEIGMVEVPWSFNMVWTQVPFYIIIAAGFAVYIIWGLVLSFVLKEKEKLRPSKVAIREKSSRIRFLKREIESLKNQIRELDEQIKNTEMAYQSKEEELEVNVYDPSQMKSCINAFAIGWNSYLSQVVGKNDQKRRSEEVMEIVEEFVNNLSSVSLNKVEK
ncbi:MAG: hypothetical protein JKY48_08370 [Flavobacteriales bacterium]|nr:hypothetical protein [Flavobacteriales bacterium]